MRNARSPLGERARPFWGFPGRAAKLRKAPRCSAVSAPFARSAISSSALGRWSQSDVQADWCYRSTIGVLEDPRVGLCTAACTLTRGLLGPCVRRLHRCRPWFRPRPRAALTAGGAFGFRSQRIARHRGAREVVEAHRCAVNSVLVAEAIEQRSAQRSHPGCGRYGRRGPSHRRETGTRRKTLPGWIAGNGVPPQRPAEGRPMVKGVSGCGTRWPSRGRGRRGLGGRKGGVNAARQVATEASESRPVSRPCSANRRAGREPGRAKWAARRESRDPRRVIAAAGRNHGARL